MKNLFKNLLFLLCFSALSRASLCAVMPLPVSTQPIKPTLGACCSSSAPAAFFKSEANSPSADLHFSRKALREQLKGTNRILLTFDDGPHPKTTPKILRILRERNLKAIFFVLGLQVKKYPELLMQIHQEGHIIGNHTFGHKNLNTLCDAEVIKQIEDTNELVKSITGVKPVLCRPPYGAANKRVLKILEGLGMRAMLWTVDPKDWKVKNEQRIYSSIKQQLGIEGPHRRGGVILMHDIYSFSANALGPVLDMLASNEYKVITADKLNSPNEAMWASLGPCLLKNGFSKGFDVEATGNSLLIAWLSKRESSYSSMELLKAAKRGKLFVYLLESDFGSSRSFCCAALPHNKSACASN